MFKKRDRNRSWRVILYIKGAWRCGIVLFGQKATKWLKLTSRNRILGVHKSSPNLASSRVGLPTVVLERKAGVAQGKLMTMWWSRKGRTAGFTCAKLWKVGMSNNRSRWLCQGSAVGAGLNSVLAPGRCHPEGVAREWLLKQLFKALLWW